MGSNERKEKENVNKLGSYAMKGASIEADVNRVMKESETIFRANEYQKNKYRYGFSVEGQGTFYENNFISTSNYDCHFYSSLSFLVFSLYFELVVY